MMTSDGGNSWYPANTGIREKNLLAVTLSPDNTTCYAWTASGKSYQSKNNGNEWKYHAVPWKLDSEVMIAFDRDVPSTVAALINRSDLYYSRDGGSTWFEVPVNQLRNKPLCMWMNAASETLYVGTDVDGVYRLSLGAILPRLFRETPAE
jgi:photosystem II stability/assembly factor-like uncharacterized protein